MPLTTDETSRVIAAAQLHAADNGARRLTADLGGRARPSRRPAGDGAIEAPA